MKTVVVISDTHGNRAAINSLLPVLSECDYIFHLGDTSQDGNFIKSLFGKKTFLLNGNCDFVSYGDEEIATRIEDVNIFACHGHRYSVKSGTDKLVARAKELNCGVALYGHTHCPEEEERDGVLVINPGTLSRYSEKSYAYLIINGNKAVCKIVYPN